MTEYLDLDDLLRIAQVAIGEDVTIRDHGLLAAASARPRASVSGRDAYADIHLKAAALLHSLARNHALVDGNKRLAWTACLTFLAINGRRVRATEDERFEFVIRVATGQDSELDDIARQLRAWTHESR